MTKTLYHIRRKVWLTQNSNGVGNMNMPYGGFNADFTVYKGINNDLEFAIKNLDRKAILLMDKNIKIRFISNDTGEFAIEKTGVVTDPQRGFAKVTLTKEDIANWTNKYFRYVVMMSNDEGNETVLYADQSKDAHGYIIISDSYIGTPTPVYEILPADFLPDTEIPVTPQCYVSQSWPGVARYSVSDMASVSVSMTNFSGEFKLEASMDDTPISGWFPVALNGNDVTTYDECTGTEAYSVEGNYQWLRVWYCPIINNAGTFDKVIIKV